MNSHSQTKRPAVAHPALEQVFVLSALRRGVAFLAVPVLLNCAPSKGARGIQAADPERQSEAEYDIARDLFQTRREARGALGHALKAVELNEDNADAAHLVGLIYLYFCAVPPSDCHLADAERYVRLALKSKPDLREAQNTLGVVLVHQRRYDEAIAVLDPLANDMLYPSPETAWGNLGWAYLSKGNADKAIEALRRAIGLQPDFCVGGYRLGLAYERKGDFRAARDAMTRALETDRPECKGLQDAYAARARASMRLGDRGAARGDLERCKQLGDDTAAGRQCVTTLATLE